MHKQLKGGFIKRQAWKRALINDKLTASKQIGINQHVMSNEGFRDFHLAPGAC